MIDFNSSGKQGFYRIVVQGRIDASWLEWFEKMKLSFGEGKTIMEGYVSDQSELHGLLNRIRDLNLPLLLVQFL